MESQEAERLTPRYLEMLKALFGAEWPKGADLTKKWAGKIARADQSTKRQHHR